MKKLFNFTIVFIALSMLTSCGRTVQIAGNNTLTPSAADYETPTEPPTEPVTEPTTVSRPQRIEIDTDMPDGYELPESCVINGFRTVMQEPELPTGCEITSLAQTMQYYGFKADKVELSDVFMIKDYDGYYTMDEVYLGDPHTDYGFGCNSSVIVSTANDYFEYTGSDWYAEDLTGITLEEVFYQVEQGRPVIVWSTIDQIESSLSFIFTLGCGEDFYFNYYQHCLTVYGYDYEKGIVYAADPLEGNVEYDLERFGRIYENMGNQAVILIGNEESAGKVYTSTDEQKKWLEINRSEEDEEDDEEKSSMPERTSAESDGETTTE